MLYSTEAAVGGRRVPDVLAGLPGSARAPAAAAMAARTSGTAARAGRPRGQAPLAAGYGPGHAARAPPARPCPKSPTGRKKNAGPTGIGPAIGDHLQLANDRDANDASNPLAARHQAEAD
jgi:hypothetical protein